jgi:FAD/FMN-containing dehydrogenase
MDQDLADRFKGLVSAAGWIDGHSPEASPYLHEWRERWVGVTPLILRPKNTDEVSAILKLAHETATAIVPQGGNTGLVGGQIPRAGQVILSLNRMTRIRALDPKSDSLIAEAGVTLSAVQAAAESADRLFPLSLASEGSATIGGLIATNAGGTAVLRYGNMRALVLGLEVVLADGAVLQRLSGLRKDNTGLDLKQLFIGTEGLHGLVTAACLSLHPKPRDSQIALVALNTVSQALDLLTKARAASGARVSAFELIPRIGLDFLARHKPDLRQPFRLEHPWYALIELTGNDPPGPLVATLQSILSDALATGLIADAVTANTIAQGLQFWALREALSEVQKFEGGSIKHDIAVPLDQMAIFIARATKAVQALCPDCRPVPFGHVGDGNIHFNISQPPNMEKAAYLTLTEPMNKAVHQIVADLGGSISAEHGIGQAKIDDLYTYLDPVSLDLMARVKAALDPKGILNPGKVLRP